MLIAWLEPPSEATQGDQVHRTRAPAAAVAAIPGVYVVAGCWLSPAVQRAAYLADVLLLCQAIDADMLPLLAHRRANGRATVVEINDHFAAPPQGSEAEPYYGSKQVQALVWQLMRLADGVQFSTHYLAQRFGAGLACSHVALAAVASPVFARHKTEPEPPLHPSAQAPAVQLGWGGSAGHAEDIAWAIPALQQVLKRHPQAHFTAMAPRSLHGMFSRLPANQLTVLPCGNFDAYQRFVARLDISIAPLLDTPFNRGRSDVKFLEATAAQAAFVGQHAPAYRETVEHGATGLLFATREDLSAALSRLITRAPERRLLQAAARVYVAAHRSLANSAVERWQFLQRVRATVAARGRAATAAPIAATAALASAPLTNHDSAGQFAALSAQAATEVSLPRGAIVAGRLCTVPLAGGSKQLFAALAAQAVGRTPAAAVAAANTAMPTFYLPPLLAAAFDPAASHAAANVERALELAPGSVVAQQVAATSWMKRGQHKWALERLRGWCPTSLSAALWCLLAECTLADRKAVDAGAGGKEARRSAAQEALAAYRRALSLCAHAPGALAGLTELLTTEPDIWAGAGSAALAGWRCCLAAARQQLADHKPEAGEQTGPAEGELARLHALAAQAAARLGHLAAARAHLLAAKRSAGTKSPAPVVCA